MANRKRAIDEISCFHYISHQAVSSVQLVYLTLEGNRMPKPCVVHIDVSWQWRNCVKEALRDTCEVVQFDDPPCVYHALMQGRRFDCIICEVTGGQGRDWSEWAKEFQNKHWQCVLVLSTTRVEGIPFVDKGRFSNRALLDALTTLRVLPTPARSEA